MSLHIEFDRLNVFLKRLERQDKGGQCEAIINECLEAGGHFTAPDRTGWSSHMFEINLYGVTAFGGSEAEAVVNWIRAAQSQLNTGDGCLEDIEDDGFITVHPPRDRSQAKPPP
jgi:hypothetical protein